MIKDFVVTDILHSGRKDIRFKECTDRKYKGVLGYVVKFDVDKIKSGRPLHWDLPNSPIYDWWDTTQVVAAFRELDTGTLYIETANTIYILKECNNVEIPGGEPLKCYILKILKEAGIK